MNKEIKYLELKIDILKSQLTTLKDSVDNYTTTVEISFYMGQLNSMINEKFLLQNILKSLKE